VKVQNQIVIGMMGEVFNIYCDESCRLSNDQSYEFNLNLVRVRRD